MEGGLGSVGTSERERTTGGEGGTAVVGHGYVDAGSCVADASLRERQRAADGRHAFIHADEPKVALVGQGREVGLAAVPGEPRR